MAAKNVNKNKTDEDTHQKHTRSTRSVGFVWPLSFYLISLKYFLFFVSVFCFIFHFCRLQTKKQTHYF